MLVRIGRRDDPIPDGVGVFFPLRHPCSPQELGRGRRPSRFSILPTLSPVYLSSQSIERKKSRRWALLPSELRSSQASSFYAVPLRKLTHADYYVEGT